MIVIDRKAPWICELAWLVAFLAELGYERAIITREYLHSMVVVFGDEQETSMNVERQAVRAPDQAVIIALFPRANRELDSSIARRIVFHDVPVTLTHSHNDKRYSAPPQTRRWSPQTRHDRSTATNQQRRRRNKEQHQPSLPLNNKNQPASPSCVSIGRCIDLTGWLVGWLVGVGEPSRSKSLHPSIRSRDMILDIATSRANIIITATVTIKIKDTRRSRTRARSESSTLPKTHRPSIESSSSSRPFASSMMVHIDGDLDAMRTCRQAIDWLQSHALDGLSRRR